MYFPSVICEVVDQFGNLIRTWEENMARARRNSNVLEQARQRLAGLKSITPVPNFGSYVSVAGYEQEITTFSSSLDIYNEMLARLDEMKNSLEAAEDSLHQMSRRILSAVEAQYGPDSSEYELAGGTRKSERERPTRRSPR
jgi:exonuclease VII small subunit